MKILITYVSQTGNTKKVAEAIAGEIKSDKEVKELKDVKSLAGYDLSFVGFPIQAFGPIKEAKEFIENHTAGKRIVLFITHASPEDNEDLQGWIDNCRKIAEGADIIDHFNCQGELARNIIDFLKKSDDPKMRSFGDYGPESKGQPDEARLEKARDFARNVINKLNE